MDLSCLGQTDQAIHEGLFSRSSKGGTADPKLIYQSERTAIYRLKDEGIKVVLDNDPSEDQILQLIHEHDISRFLPAGCRKRRTIDVRGFKGRPALYFHWTHGKTLSEWLRMARQQSGVDLSVRLRVAIAIAEALHTFHDEGVVHNNLSPGNIVLDTSEGSSIATLIDLSNAWIHPTKDEQFTSQLAETDLKYLSWILKELFCPDNYIPDLDNAVQGPSGSLTVEKDEDRKEDPSIARKRGKPRSSVGEDLPIYLGTLISSLLHSGGGDNNTPPSLQRCYNCARDVLVDLREAERKSQIFLKPLILDEFLVRGRLRLPADAYYGRKPEVSKLLHALSSVRMPGGHPMFVSISGSPGTGKTSLANQIKLPLQEAGGFFINGKFDPRMQSNSIIFSALDRFYSTVNERAAECGEDSAREEMASRIYESLGPGGCGALMKSIPSLQTVMQRRCDISDGDSCTNKTVDVAEFQSNPTHRKYLFCKLIAATASQACPLAIFLDDLQWADETTLDVFRMIVTDPDIRYCLFLGVYRDNQSNSTAKLKKLLQAIQEQGVGMMSLKTGPMEKDCINVMLSETLCLPPRVAQPLSAIIHKKTGGVGLFVMNFLKSLNEQGLLWFDMSSRSWKYNHGGIELKEISDDVVEHMSKRMKHLPQGMQLGLKLSAYLGSKFDAKALEKGIPGNRIDVKEFLDFSVEGGYIRKVSPGMYIWTHDQVQQAAYELVPRGKRETFHMLLGSRIFLQTSPDDLDQMIYCIVGNMNIGIRLIKSREQKFEVARLNLTAGEKMIASSSFNGAVSYLKMGIALLPENSWEDDYDLTIRLYDSAAEALYVTGDFETLSSIIEMPLSRARRFKDKLNSYLILVRFLIASCEHKEAITKCLNVLAQLGELIPPIIDKTIYAEEVKRVKHLLMNLSEDDLLSIPLMTDEHKSACMQFLSLAIGAAFQLGTLLGPFMLLRMVRLSISYGVCKMSTFAFAGYGVWHVTADISDYEGGYRMGRLALSLIDKLDAKEFIPRVYLAVYSMVNIWKEPFQACLEKLLEGHDAGALSGDIEYAADCLLHNAMLALNCCGKDLGMLEKTIRFYIRRSVQWNQTHFTKSLVLAHDYALKLIGPRESSSPFFDSGEDAVYQISVEQGENIVIQYILHKRKVLAFFYGDMDAAAKYYEMGTEQNLKTHGRFGHTCLGVVIDGLIAFYFAREHPANSNRWQKIGEAALDLTKQWAMSSDWNFANKLYLLEAEYFFTKSDQGKALEMYKQSINAAKDHDFIHEEGIAFERAAQFHLQQGNIEEALVCLTESKKCYSTWGAHGLVNYIERLILNLS